MIVGIGVGVIVGIGVGVIVGSGVGEGVGDEVSLSVTVTVIVPAADTPRTVTTPPPLNPNTTTLSLRYTPSLGTFIVTVLTVPFVAREKPREPTVTGLPPSVLSVMVTEQASVVAHKPLSCSVPVIVTSCPSITVVGLNETTMQGSMPIKSAQLAVCACAIGGASGTAELNRPKSRIAITTVMGAMAAMRGAWERIRFSIAGQEGNYPAPFLFAFACVMFICCSQAACARLGIARIMSRHFATELLHKLVIEYNICLISGVIPNFANNIV